MQGRSCESVDIHSKTLSLSNLFWRMFLSSSANSSSSSRTTSTPRRWWCSNFVRIAALEIHSLNRCSNVSNSTLRAMCPSAKPVGKTTAVERSMVMQTSPPTTLISFSPHASFLLFLSPLLSFLLPSPPFLLPSSLPPTPLFPSYLPSLLTFLPWFSFCCLVRSCNTSLAETKNTLFRAVCSSMTFSS